MNSTSQSENAICPSDAHATRKFRDRVGAADLFLLSAWCGLFAGLLEVLARVLGRAIDPTQRIYLLSRHFLWLGPLSNLLFFLGMGLFLAIGVKLWPREAQWVGPRLICACAVFPVLIAVGPHIYAEAWFVFGVGLAMKLAPILERQIACSRRRLLWGISMMLAVVIPLAGFVFVGDWLKLRREANRPLPPANSPNVLLIVLDTVRSDHLSAYGYNRPTTPALDRLASHGIRFDHARATIPWTLPSHASMFTGHWPHEIGEQWMTPIRSNFPTLAEYLGNHGYATAGFVGNVGYCSQETGLARGFTHYEDYVLEKLAPLRTSGLIDNLVGAVTQLIPTLELSALRPLNQFLVHWFEINKRKDAKSIKLAFLSWLTARQEPGRPFFAFLNFFDAHDPYVLPEGEPRRFVRGPVTMEQAIVVYELWPLFAKQNLNQASLDLARDSYDDCLGYLDLQLGRLLDALDGRGLLRNTLVIVTSDHGEGFGEHGLFGHGVSLYQTEIRVPLLIRPPSGLSSSKVVSEPVSLRDLPATIVDLLGLEAGSPFPGGSLARFWRDSPPRSADLSRESGLVASELRFPNPLLPMQGGSSRFQGPLVSLALDRFVYIRNERLGSEQLFDEHADPNEANDQAGNASLRPVLDEFRRRFNQFRTK